MTTFQKWIIAILVGGGLLSLYYLTVYTPQQQKVKEEQKQAQRLEGIKEKCITQTLKELKDTHPLMETREITNYRVSNDRACFIEAGGMTDNYNESQYQTCLAGIKQEVAEMIEAEKQKRISDCIKLYEQSSF